MPLPNLGQWVTVSRDADSNLVISLTDEGINALGTHKSDELVAVWDTYLTALLAQVNATQLNSLDPANVKPVAFLSLGGKLYTYLGWQYNHPLYTLYHEHQLVLTLM